MLESWERGTPSKGELEAERVKDVCSAVSLTLYLLVPPPLLPVSLQKERRFFGVSNDPGCLV